MPDGPAGEAQGDRDDVLDREARRPEAGRHGAHLDDRLIGQPEEGVDVMDPEPAEDPAAGRDRVEERVARVAHLDG